MEELHLLTLFLHPLQGESGAPIPAATALRCWGGLPKVARQALRKANVNSVSALEEQILSLLEQVT